MGLAENIFVHFWYDSYYLEIHVITYMLSIKNEYIY